jgi:hypothetical protein
VVQSAGVSSAEESPESPVSPESPDSSGSVESGVAEVVVVLAESSEVNGLSIVGMLSGVTISPVPGFTHVG